MSIAVTQTNKDIIKHISELAGASSSRLNSGILPVDNVPEEHQIKVVVLHTFVCPTGSRDERKYVRAGVEQIVDEERLEVIRDGVDDGSVTRFIPAEFWNDDQSSFEMRHRFLAAYQVNPTKYASWFDAPDDESVFVEYEITTTVGCKHYVRGCVNKCADCSDDSCFHVCSRCHKEVASDIGLNDDDCEADIHEDFVQSGRIKCLYCDEEQDIGLECTKCHHSFGNYICEECGVVAISSDHRPAYHCNDCNHCIVGSASLFKHCDCCKKCVFESLYDTHVEVCKGDFVSDCIVCAESLVDTNVPFGALPCNKDHFIHYHCYQKILTEGLMVCPICKQCIVTKEFIMKDKVKFF